MNDFEQLKIEFDKDDMCNAISSFPEQLEYMLEKFSKWTTRKSYTGLNHIIILGMGGSAIGGDLAKILISKKCRIPTFVNRNYTIPGWVNDKTLVIASSYSGNTEETLEAFSECKKRNALCIIISTGGELTNRGEEANCDIIKIPSGLQPRAALGYSVMAVLFALNKSGYITDTVINQINESLDALKAFSKQLKQLNKRNKAQELAEQIYNTTPVLYGSAGFMSIIAMRFRGQLEENAKMISFHNDIPEMNHNEIEGWGGINKQSNRYSIIWITDERDHPQVMKRIDISRELLSKNCSNQYILKTNGKNFIERVLKLIHFVDWVSLYTALLNSVDPTPVVQIQKLKKHLK